MDKRMTLEENIFFAKRKLVDNIYESARLEGIDITFGDTYAFSMNINTGKINVADMLKLRGLEDAWKYVFNTFEDTLTIDYIKRIHFEVCKGESVTPLGDFRDIEVGITGTTYKPKLPRDCNYEVELEEIMSNPNDLDRTLDLFCWIQRSQMFRDGNKRVANIVANKEMIKHGLGRLSIPVDLIDEYKHILIKYYETNDNNSLKEFLKNNCLDGLDLVQ